MVQLPALSISSNHWFAVGRWKITRIQKFAIASESNIQQIWSTRISLTKQLILPVIDVINNSWALYYPDLYSCINQGYIACFLCYFSSWMLKRGADMVNEIQFFFLWIFLLLKSNIFSQWSEDASALFVCDIQLWKLPSHPARLAFWILPILAQSHSFREIMLSLPFSLTSLLMLKM